MRRFQVLSFIAAANFGTVACYVDDVHVHIPELPDLPELPEAPNEDEPSTPNVPTDDDPGAPNTPGSEPSGPALPNPSEPGPAIPLNSLTYFVNPDLGSDENDGQSPDSAWRTLAQVQNSVDVTSAKVYLHSAGVFRRQKIQIEWGGTADNWALVSCYFMNDGSPYECTADHPKPSIQGRLTLECLESGTCDYSEAAFAGDPLSSQWDALVTLMPTADYLIFRHIEIAFSSAIPLRATGQRNADLLHHFVIDDVSVKYAGNTPILVENDARDFVIRNSNVDIYNTCMQQRSKFGWTALTETCNYPGWPGGIQIVRSRRAQALIENNTITRGFGEGINCYQNTSHMIIRGNRVSNVWSGGIYLDVCSDTVVENNIVIGTKGDLGLFSDPYNLSEWFSRWGGGITVGWEDINIHWGDDGVNNLIRNNLAIDTGPGIEIGTEAEAEAAGVLVGAAIFGNTVISSNSSDMTSYLTENNTDEELRTNNVSWNQTRGQGACSLSNTTVVESNHWYVTPSDANCVGVNDTFGDPKLRVQPYSEWDAFDYRRFPTFESATPDPDSPLRGSGDSMPIHVSFLNAADFGFAFESISDDIDRDCWEKGLCYDALGVRRDPESVTKGAVQ